MKNKRIIAVPMVISGGGIKKRGATDEITDFSDILPTLVDFAGAKIPDGYEVDGKSLKPFLTGQTDKHRDYFWILRQGQDVQQIS